MVVHKYAAFNTHFSLRLLRKYQGCSAGAGHSSFLYSLFGVFISLSWTLLFHMWHTIVSHLVNGVSIVALGFHTWISNPIISQSLLCTYIGFYSALSLVRIKSKPCTLFLARRTAFAPLNILKLGNENNFQWPMSPGLPELPIFEISGSSSRQIPAPAPAPAPAPTPTPTHSHSHTYSHTYSHSHTYSYSYSHSHSHT